MEQIKARGFVRISGADSAKFLQGLITNNIFKLDEVNLIHSLMLTPQGKYLFDFYIFKEKENEYILDCQAELLNEIINKLKIYKLRSDVAISLDEKYKLILANNQTALSPSLSNNNSIIYEQDPLVKNFYRIYLPISLAENSIKSQDELYQEQIFEQTIPTAPDDLKSGESFPMFFGFDKLGSIDFSKGCYVGQELTARMNYRGLVRKNLFKLTSNSSVEEFIGAEIKTHDDKIIGKLLSAKNNLGKALVEVENFAEDVYVSQAQAKLIAVAVKHK